MSLMFREPMWTLQDVERMSAQMSDSDKDLLAAVILRTTQAMIGMHQGCRHCGMAYQRVGHVHSCPVRWAQARAKLKNGGL